jgi:hypothetical protein
VGQLKLIALGGIVVARRGAVVDEVAWVLALGGGVARRFVVVF